MPIRDILLLLVGEPSAAAIAVIDRCVAVAGNIGAQVTAIAIEEDILVRPKVMISDDLDNAAMAEAVRSVTDAQGLQKAFDAAAVRYAVRGERRVVRIAAADIPTHFALEARLKDMSIVPVKPDGGQSERIVERLIFESGRPILICPEEFVGELEVAFDDVVIAWDHTAPAARAVADALPMLQAATTVRVVTATDERTAEQRESGTALVRHLADARNQGQFRDGENRRQFGRKGVRGLCPRQCD
jgi:hypothetical protein